VLLGSGHYLLREGLVNFGRGLCFFGRPFGVGHNFMGPHLGVFLGAHLGWASISGRLSLKHWVMCTNGFCAIDLSIASESS